MTDTELDLSIDLSKSYSNLKVNCAKVGIITSMPPNIVKLAQRYLNLSICSLDISRI